MTFRARPSCDASRTPSWEADDRRDFYLNLGFGLAVVAAVAHPRGSPSRLSYYNDHLASVGSVAGQSITKDELRDRDAIEKWRLDRGDARIRTRRRGRPADAGPGGRPDAVHRAAAPAARRDRARADHRQPASRRSSPTQEGVDGHGRRRRRPAADEATTPETRHAWADRGQARDVDAGADRADRRTEGRGQGQGRRGARRPQGRQGVGGRRQDRLDRHLDRARRPATSAGSQQGRQPDRRGVRAGALRRRGRTRRPPSSRATDGIFRIGRVTEIAARGGRRRLHRQDSSTTASTSPSTGRSSAATSSARSSRTRSWPRRRKPGPQREVREIYLQRERPPTCPPTAVKVRAHPVLARRTTRRAPRTARSPRTIPSWAKAEADADGGLRQAAGRPDASSTPSPAPRATRRAPAAPTAPAACSPPTSATTAATSSRSRSRSSRRSRPTARSCAPIKTAFGWHIVQVLSHAPGPSPGDQDRRSTAAPTSPTLARDISEGAEASKGGDLGWIAKGQLDRQLIATRSSRRRSARRPTVVTDRRTTASTCSRSSRRGERTPDGRQLDDDQGPRLLRLVHSRRRTPSTVERDDADRPELRRLGGRPCSTRSSPRRDSGSGSIRPPGCRSSPAERLIATPIEPSRPVLVVPLAMLLPGRRGPPGAGEASTRPLPGRHGPARPRRRWTCSRVPIPPTIPVGRFGTTRVHDDRRAPGRRPRRTALPRAAGARGWPSQGRGRCPRSAPGCARRMAARGIASRPTSRCASTCSRRRTRSTTRSRPGRRRSSPASSATCCSRSSSTPSSRPRRASST